MIAGATIGFHENARFRSRFICLAGPESAETALNARDRAIIRRCPGANGLSAVSLALDRDPPTASGVRVNQELPLSLISGWPVISCTSLLLGYVTFWSLDRRRHLVWYLPVLLAAAIAFVLVAGGPISTPLLAAETLGIGIVAVFPAVAIAFVVACLVLHYRAPAWMLFCAPAIACLLSTPIVGYVARFVVCELTGDCM